MQTLILMTYLHYDIGDGNMPSIITRKQLYVAFSEQQWGTLLIVVYMTPLSAEKTLKVVS